MLEHSNLQGYVLLKDWGVFVSADRPVYERLADAYRAEYGAFVHRIAELGPVSMVELQQTAGDFSDPATGDLHIMRVLSRARAHLDLGVGNFSPWIPPSAFVVNPAGFANSIVVDQPHRVDAACIQWSALLDLDVEGRLPTDGSFGAVHGRMTRDPEMANVFDHLWSIEQSETAELQTEAALVWIGQRLVDWTAWPTAPARKPTEKLSPRSLARTKERLEATGPDTPSLAELAAQCRLSPHHFCRAFKAATGLPPHRYQIVVTWSGLETCCCARMIQLPKLVQLSAMTIRLISAGCLHARRERLPLHGDADICHDHGAVLAGRKL